MTTPGPLVSVVIPTRNRVGLLKRSVFSVLSQTISDLELIVVNDGSTDGTRELLASIDDPRLHVIHRETGGGAASARNAGIAQATGEYISFQDDDDFWFVNKLETQLDAMRSAEQPSRWSLASFIRTTHRISYIGDDAKYRTLDFTEGIYDEGPDWSLISTPSWLVRRDFFDEVGVFDERIRSYDDWELALRMWKVERPLIVLDPVWMQDWRNGGGLTKNELARANDVVIILEKHPDVWEGHRKPLSRMLYYVGRTQAGTMPRPGGRKMILRAIRVDPLFWRPWVSLVLSFIDRERAQALTMGLRRVFRMENRARWFRSIR